LFLTGPIQFLEDTFLDGVQTGTLEQRLAALEKNLLGKNTEFRQLTRRFRKK
jgi:hypothetical protein